MTHRDTLTAEDEQAPRPAPRAHQFLLLDEVIDRVKLSRRTIYNKIDSGEFPKPVSLGARRIAFVEAEILEWQEALMEARG